MAPLRPPGRYRLRERLGVSPPRSKPEELDEVNVKAEPGAIGVFDRRGDVKP